MPAYVPLTLQLKPEWVESFYRLLSDLSEGRIKEYKRQSIFAKLNEQVEIAKPKPASFPNCIAKYCNCGRCFSKIVRDHKFPWKLCVDNKIYQARDGKQVTLCSALYAGLKENYEVNELLGHIVKSSYELNFIKQKNDDVKQDEILDLKKRSDLRAERKCKVDTKSVALTNQDLEHQIARDKVTDIKKEMDVDKCLYCNRGHKKSCYIKHGDDVDDDGNVREIEAIVKDRNANGREIEVTSAEWDDHRYRTDVEFIYKDHHDKCKLVQGLKETHKKYVAEGQQSSGAENKTRRYQTDMVAKLEKGNEKPNVAQGRKTKSTPFGKTVAFETELKDRYYY